MITSNYQVDGDIYSYADRFFCDSHDDKPSNADARDGLINGAILEETDTGKTYIFDKKANQWTEKAAGGGGGGGSTTLAGLTDVDISNPSNGQTLVYNSTSGMWENGNPAGGGYALLDGVYDVATGSLTLANTAESLYTLMQAKSVFLRYTSQPNADYSEIRIISLYAGIYIDDAGDIAYMFQASGNFGTAYLAASDSVVFTGNQ